MRLFAFLLGLHHQGPQHQTRADGGGDEHQEQIKHRAMVIQLRTEHDGQHDHRDEDRQKDLRDLVLRREKEHDIKKRERNEDASRGDAVPDPVKAPGIDPGGLEEHEHAEGDQDRADQQQLVFLVQFARSFSRDGPAVPLAPALSSGRTAVKSRNAL